MANILTPQTIIQESSNTNINVLDQYDVSTYHLKLFAAPFLGVDLDTVEPGFIIAESGVTDIGINNLQFMSTFGFQEDTYTSFATKFTFELKEPLGTTLLDRMRIAANNVGADNFIKMPFFLEVTFLGRDKSSGTPVNIPAKKVYPIHILDIKIRVDKGGSVYTCSAVQVHDYAHNDQSGVISKDLVLEVQDLQDALCKIQDHLNDEEYKHEQDANHLAVNNKDTYLFEIHPDILALGQFIGDSPQKTKSSRNDLYLELTDDKTTIHINDGTSIGRVIDLLMVNTKYLQSKINKQEPEQNRKQGWVEKDVYKIKSKIKLPSYDEGRKDYDREITYQIEPFTLHTGFSNPAETQAKTLPSDYIGPIGSAARVVKNYNYIFTGKNFHVIDFDFNVNLAWFMAMPRQHGFFTNPNQPDVGKLYVPRDSGEKADPNWKEKEDEANKTSGGPANNVQTPDQDNDPDGSLSGQSSGNYIRRPTNTAGLFPPSFIEYAYEHDGVGVIEGERTAARGKTGSLLKSYITNNVAEFIKIEVVIRGDPFWLTASDDKQLYFIFNTGLPQEPAEDGLIPPPEDTLVTGLFQILQVRNTFSDGKFIQTLVGRRDVLTRIIGRNGGNA